MSHPSWVRGLKRKSYVWYSLHSRSHPSWVRGLKLTIVRLLRTFHLSHPSWVRGLKLPNWLMSKRVAIVAPLVGAWIETHAQYRQY